MFQEAVRVSQIEVIADRYDKHRSTSANLEAPEVQYCWVNVLD